jgi:site-specific DNA recombinase
MANPPFNVDAKEEKRIVGIKPKLPLGPIFQVATTEDGSGLVLINEPPVLSPEARDYFLVETGESRTPRPEERSSESLQA